MTLIASDRDRQSFAPRFPNGSNAQDSIYEIGALKPRTISEALVCMELTLEHFHHHSDYRAVFLHAYYLITRNVRQTIERQRQSSNSFFHDPDWMSLLAGHFATLYFESIGAFERDAYNGTAWQLAHRMAIDKESTVIQDMLLGINAHIGYDLAQAICRNIVAHDDHRDDAVLESRKRDHDQANRILTRSIADIWYDIPRAYGGVLWGVDAMMLRTDRYMARVALQHYREGVWWHAMDLVDARTDGEVERVRLAMDRKSTGIAEAIASIRRPWMAPALRVARFARKKDLTSLVRNGRSEVGGD